MSKKKLSVFAAIATIAVTTVFAGDALAWWGYRWTQVGTQVSGYYGLPMRHCGNDAYGPGECTAQDYYSRQTCFMYWGSRDLGNGYKEYPIFQCQQRW